MEIEIGKNLERLIDNNASLKRKVEELIRSVREMLESDRSFDLTIYGNLSEGGESLDLKISKVFH